MISESAPDGSGSVPATDYAANGAGGGIEVRSGGHLNIGTEGSGTDGAYYSVGDALIIAKKGEYNGQPSASDVATAAILGLPGSSITLKGCTINLTAPFRLDGTRPGGGAANAACIFRAKDVTMYVAPDDTTGYFAPRLFTDDYQIDGWRQIGGTFQIQARKASSFIRNIRLERMIGGLGVTGNSFGALTDFPGEGARQDDPGLGQQDVSPDRIRAIRYPKGTRA